MKNFWIIVLLSLFGMVACSTMPSAESKSASEQQQEQHRDAMLLRPGL